MALGGEGWDVGVLRPFLRLCSSFQLPEATRVLRLMVPSVLSILSLSLTSRLPPVSALCSPCAVWKIQGHLSGSLKDLDSIHSRAAPFSMFGSGVLPSEMRVWTS